MRIYKNINTDITRADWLKLSQKFSAGNMGDSGLSNKQPDEKVDMYSTYPVSSTPKFLQHTYLENIYVGVYQCIQKMEQIRQTLAQARESYHDVPPKRLYSNPKSLERMSHACDVLPDICDDFTNGLELKSQAPEIQP